MTRGPVVVHQNQQGDVTEWMISVCQSGELESNACTIIAVLVAVNFLLPTGWILPCPQKNLPQAFTRMFKELMIQGNIVHQWVGHAQLTYSAPEIRKSSSTLSWILVVLPNVGMSTNLHPSSSFLLSLNLSSSTLVKQKWL